MKILISRKRVLTLLGGIALSLLGFGLYVPIKNFINRYTAPRPEEVTWVNIFVHGSFGSLLGFLSFSDVLSDKVSGTIYRDTTKKMRMDDFFFKDQPILQRGLRRIQPTLEARETGFKSYAVYPISTAFLEIAKEYELGLYGREFRTRQVFYSFGWSGLISQNSRRYEAIRLYNSLVAEIKKLKNEYSYKLKIRLIAHSHGGNLCLNLAAIHKLLKTKHAFGEDTVFSADPDEQGSLVSMMTLLKGLTTKEIAATKVDQKMYDYFPESSDLVIDQLVMLGTPIQPETESFSYSPFFKEVYNLYSDEDYVQRADWVSSKKSLSSARIAKKPTLQAVKSNDIATLYQGQIIIKSSTDIPAAKQAPSVPAGEVEQMNIFQQLLAGKNIFVRKSADPTHKELWFLNWEKSTEGNSVLPCAPLPVVVFLPLILDAFKKPKSPHDAVIIMGMDKKKFTVSIAKYKTKEIVNNAEVTTELVEYLQEKVREWAPKDTTGLSEFEVINKIVAP